MSSPPNTLAPVRGSSTDEPEVSDRTLAIGLRKRLHEVRCFSLFIRAFGMGTSGDVYASAMCVGVDGKNVEAKACAESLDQTLIDLLAAIDEAVNAKPRARKGTDER